MSFEAYDYQADAILELSEALGAGVPEVGIYFVMGAGKTMTGLGLVAKMAPRNFLVATPQNSITEGWLDYSEQDLRLESETLRLPKVRNRDPALNVTTQIERHLVSCPGGLVVNYQSVTEFLNRPIESLRPHVQGRILLCDEGHHTWKGRGWTEEDDEPSRNWAVIRPKWTQAGGRIIVMSATPWDEDYEIPHCERSFSDQMWTGKAPRNLKFDTIVEPTLDGKVAAAVRKWEESGRPATIVRVEQSDRSSNLQITAALVSAFESCGVRVVNAYGEGGEEAVHAAQAYYRDTPNLSYEDPLLPRVFVTMKRLGEGTNLPWVSNLIFLEIPGSAQAFDQSFGRALRNRFDADRKASMRDYPEEWLDSAQATVIMSAPASQDRNWTALCQRLVSYRNASLLMEGAPVGMPRRQSEEGESDDSAAPIDTRTRNLVETYLARARAMLQRSPEGSSHTFKDQAEVAAHLAANDWEASQPHKVSDDEKRTYRKRFLQDANSILRASNPDLSRPMPFLDIPAEAVEAFLRVAFVGGSRREADHEAVTMVGELAHRVEAVTDETVVEALRGYLAEHGTLPQPTTFKRRYPRESRYLNAGSTSLGVFALKALGTGEPWFELLDRLDQAGSGRAKVHPEEVYFKGALNLVHFPELRGLSLEEAHVLGSLPKARLQKLRETTTLSELRALLYSADGLLLTVSAFQTLVQEQVAA